MGQHEMAEEFAVAPFDLVILVARDARITPALQRQAILMHVDADLLTRESRQFGSKDERVSGLTQVNGRRPTLWPMRREALQPMLNTYQVAEGIPAREHHDSSNVARWGACPRAGRSGPAEARNGEAYAKLVRFY